jgi:ribosomal 30S subunit maturation factor RimM
LNDRTHIGVVLTVSPGQRRLRIEMATSFVSYALSLSVLECRKKDGSVLKCRVASSTKTSDGIAVMFVAGVPRDTIAQLKKARIVVASDHIVRDPQRYDIEELVGLSVFDAEGMDVAIVASGFDTTANGMIEVQLTNGAVMVLPVVPEVVDRVDWLVNRVVLQPGVPLDVIFG